MLRDKYSCKRGETLGSEQGSQTLRHFRPRYEVQDGKIWDRDRLYRQGPFFQITSQVRIQDGATIL